ncbi:flagellar hook assembly protein FlgD [Fictibacillus phosphorivorans]|uniref:flagellar hook assembly protein FlgD n=1 Tax=Fictibacillus phosphorivorans TaxID=1221500 RepID=UPI00203BBCEB|nr:flagellar hook assembly protein FlgD [Fictibacillus phosphorivorans]MCM3717155.1 flagellar hook assembly protein FlgD [Fictibacillus phosphorivorans]MCM3774842.1 flagellar hook assembly protein FlgD [Fictibacillus phosphorivorans]
MSKVSENLMLSNYQANTKQTGSNILGKDDFLKILITQLQNQDPTSPMQDREFIAQMASFSSLEQMTNMNKTMQQFLTFQTEASLLQQSQMIGKQVTYETETINEKGEKVLEEKEDTVNSVLFEKGLVMLEMSDGSKITSFQVIKITDPAN